LIDDPWACSSIEWQCPGLLIVATMEVFHYRGLAAPGYRYDDSLFFKILYKPMACARRNKIREKNRLNNMPCALKP